MDRYRLDRNRIYRSKNGRYVLAKIALRYQKIVDLFLNGCKTTNIDLSNKINLLLIEINTIEQLEKNAK